MKHKKILISIRIDESLLALIDSLVEGTSFTRSSYINKLLESILR